MKVTALYIKEFNQFKDFRLDLTYPEGHPKAGQALEKVCLIGQSGTGKTSLIEILYKASNVTSVLAKSLNLHRSSKDTFHNDNNDNKFIELFLNGLEVSFNNNLTAKFFKDNKSNNPFNDTFDVFFQEIEQEKEITVDDNTFKLFLYPSEMELSKSKKSLKEEPEGFKPIDKERFFDFGNYDLQSSWTTINQAIIKDREVEIKKSLEISKILQNPNISQEEVLKARSEFLAWRKSSPNPLVDLAENYLDKILNRFNLKVKTELDFEKTEDIKTIKIQTQQGKDIPFEELSTGTKQVILTALPLYGLKPEKSIILFDEPERSLYPDIQTEIVNFYTSMAKDSQFFFATHSPLVASAFEPWEIVELKFNDEGHVYQELYYDPAKGRHVDNYTIYPQYLTWTGILQKVFDLDQEGNGLRNRQLMRVAMLEAQLKNKELGLEDKKEKFEEYKKLATLLNWELK